MDGCLRDSRQIRRSRRGVLDKGVAHVRRQFEQSAQKGRISDTRASYLGELVQGTLDIGDFADCDFVIEAVFEEMAVKKKVFAEAESVMKADAILGTNTSSLSVTEMGSDLKNPERLVGFHFFNPVALMPLVEVIKAEKTGDLALATAFDLAKKLKKTGILVKGLAGAGGNDDLLNPQVLRARGGQFDDLARILLSRVLENDHKIPPDESRPNPDPEAVRSQLPPSLCSAPAGCQRGSAAFRMT